MKNRLQRYLRAASCRAFRNGDNEAFAKIYRRFRKPIFHYVSTRVFDKQSAEDVTQEVFIKAYRFREAYDEQYAFSTWLWTIARNTVFDALRKNKSAEDLPAAASSIDEIPSPFQNAESLLQVKDLRRLIKSMMRPLTKLQRRVLWMSVIQQRSYAEISKQMGLSLSAVKNLAYRARLTITDSFGAAPDFIFN